MNIIADDFALFNRKYFTFKQLKEEKSIEEIEKIKDTYKEHWQKWKALQLQTASLLPKEFLMSQPKIESWTNGWNLRNHFWSAYRSENRKEESACLAVLLNKKQYQIYLMFQHYKSEERMGNKQEYNHLLDSLAQWSQEVDITDYYIWPQPEHELEEHLSLSTYLTDEAQQKELKKAMKDKTFQIGKLLYKKEEIKDVEKITAKTLQELAPLYSSIGQKNEKI